MAGMSGFANGFLDDSRIFIDDTGLGEPGPDGGDFLARCGQLSVFTCRDPGKPTPAEDAVGVFRISTQAWVFAVADGVGGAVGGRAAALTTLSALGEALGNVSGEPMALRSAILDGIEQANRAVLERGNGGATTLAVAELGPDYVRSYHVGDSSVMLVGQRGRLKVQTVPHSPVGFAVEAGLLQAREAMHHELLHVISNVIGSSGMRIEVGPEVPLADRDTLLLASDGLFDNLFAEEIVERIRRGDLPKAMASLRSLVTERMAGTRPAQPSKPDDCSIVLFRRHVAGSARAWRAHDPGTRDWLGDE
jgi:PPM family protein phosphatase